MLRKLFIFLLIFCSTGVFAQNAKSHIKAAEQFIANGYHEEAIAQYTLAIGYDPQSGEAYLARAKSYEFLNQTEAAAKDYTNAAVFGVNPGENYLRSAEQYFLLENFPLAEKTVLNAIHAKSKNYEAYLLQCRIFLETEKYDAALSAASNALDSRNTAYALYLKGTSEHKLGNYQQAEQDLEKAIIKDKMLLEAFLSLAEVQLINNKLNYAIDNCSYVILNSRDNKKAYLLRSKIYSEDRQFENAIIDASKAINIDSTDASILIFRGKLYMEYAQFEKAINDFTVALNTDMFNQEALELRAIANEKTRRNSLAVSDYALLLKLDDSDEASKDEYYESRIFELNRESSKPQLSVLSPLMNDKYEIPVPNDAVKVTVKTKVEDVSPLKFLRINNDTLFYDSKGITPGEFTAEFETRNLEYFTISAGDVYDNTTTISYTVNLIETHAPEVTLMNPYPGDDGIIEVSSDDKFLYLEGRIRDESKIASILIDEVTASYSQQDINPRFTATLDITKKNKIRVVATDIYGNHFEQEYLFRRNGQLTTDNDSPMGKTWVVLIENSEYKDFPNLNSPEQDIQLMQQALSRYKINKVIVKKNLSKREMERFFSIDLRDLIRTNNVNSLLIWFAGHGENINGNGYWIPSDANMDIEFSYFNINALKASLYSYTSLTHLLVVSDACETGPGFVTAMRGPVTGVSCSQTQFALKKSAQVFTSAGSGYAYDNSMFTKAFANTLLNNEDDCSTIDDIAKRVSLIIRNSSNQKPEFGRISGIDDELGTFFFISR